MGRILDSFRAGVQGRDFPKGQQFVVADKAVACLHCGKDQFIEGKAQLHTALMSFFDLEWAQPTAHTLTCTNCGRIEWFLGDPKTVEETQGR
jgi:predicted nucleic-acid-binding Zn-ribbon protein